MSHFSHTAPTGVRVRDLSMAEEKVMDGIADLFKQLTGTDTDRIVALVDIGTYFTPPNLSQDAVTYLRSNGPDIL